MNAEITHIGVVQSKIEAADARWSWLYKIAGMASLLSVLFFPIQIIVYFVSPPPSTVIGWFGLLQARPLIGLLDLDLLLMVDQVLAIPIFLALYIALRKTHESFTVLGLVLGLFSMVLFIASNPAYALLSLSDQYVAAGTEAQRAAFLAAGQAMLAIYQGSAFQVSYIVGSIAAIIISVVMLRSRLFSKATAYLGILANGIALGLYVPEIGIYISIFSVVFLWAWYIFLARRFFQLGNGQGGLG
jgi:hypothetical protein